MSACNTEAPIRGLFLLVLTAVLCPLVSLSSIVDAQTPSNALPVSGGSGWALAFSDEFNTNSLDTSKWGVDVSASSRAARPERGIDDWWWKSENVSLDGSNLVLDVVKHDDNTMYCGSVSSDGLYEPTYGYLEARIKIADSTKDTHTAFWLQGENMGNVDGTGNDGAEVDIFESAEFGDNLNCVVHIDGYGGSHQASTQSYSTPGIHSGYHVFGLEWNFNSMKVYYDGVHKTTYTGIWVPRVPEFLWLSDGASFGDIGTFTNEATGLLTSAQIDYVRVWQAASNWVPDFAADPVEKAPATENMAYTNTLAGSATDDDGDPITYAKLSGPPWLSVGTNGPLTGTPSSGDIGTNSWTVQASDGNGGTNTATLQIVVNGVGVPVTLVGGALLNGDFNAAGGATVTYSGTPEWYNLDGNQDSVATRADESFDGSQNALVQSGRLPGLDTGYSIVEGDTFDVSYVWKDSFDWADGTDQITISLFVTSDNTPSGTRTDLVVHPSGLSTVNSTYEAVAVDGVYTASASDEGKTLFLAMETIATHFSRIDNVVLVVNPSVPRVTLTVTSDQGSPSPSGITTPVSNSTVNASVLDAPVVNGTTQYVCTGWTLTGNEPTSGTGTNVSMTLTNDATLTWLWSTQYRLDLSTDTGGSLDEVDQWVNATSNVVVTGTPYGSNTFSSWSGDTNGCAILSNQITVLMDQPRSIVAAFESADGSPLYATPTWSDEFDGSGPPNPAIWTFEEGFVRNEELQWYQTNAWQEGGVLVIEGRREQVPNPNFTTAGDSNWKLNREFAEYTAASIRTDPNYSFQYGRMQVRAKLPCVLGSWPAIWTLGDAGEWPSNGECDILEYYLYGGNPTVLANCAVGTTTRWSAKWDSTHTPVTDFTAVDPAWESEFHVWTMQWDQDYVRLYLDNILLNTTAQSWLKNAVTTWGPQDPFKQPHHVLLNLALGANGGDPSGTTFPIRYEVDYVRVWEGATNNITPTDIAILTNSVGENLPAGTVIANVTATDEDAGEVISFSLVSGTGDTDNGSFEISFVSGETRASVLKTKAVLDYQAGATRSIRVRATDIEGATFDKILLINVVPDPDIVVSTDSIAVPEGGTNTFSVRLLSVPSNTVTVNVSRASGDSDLSVQSGAALFFTPANGTNWQQVVLTAAEDADWTNGAASFLCEDAGATYNSATVNADEVDNDNDAPLVDAGTNQTVYVAVAAGDPVTGAEIFLDAGLDAGTNSTWEDSLGLWDLAINAGVTHNADAGSALSGISAAYDFPGGTGGNGGCDGLGLQELSVNTQPITLELWFKPDLSLAYTMNGQVLWETGGGTGLGIFYSNGVVEVAHDSNAQEISTDVSALTNDFIQVVVTYDTTTTTDSYKLYINGELRVTDSRNDGNMCGGDASGLGNRGDANVGGRGSGDVSTESFEGQIAIFRAYHNEILDADGVMSNYNSVAGSEVVANLDATVSDPNGDPTTATWSFVSGPSSVTFGDENAVDTTVALRSVGTYILRLTADDGTDEAFSDVTVVVNEQGGTSGVSVVLQTWVVSGQSNAEGYGITESPVSGLLPATTLASIGRSDLNVTHSNVWFYQGTNDYNYVSASAGMALPPKNSWHSMTAYEGLAFDWGAGQEYESGRRFGPELAFGFDVHAHVGSPIGLVKYARGSIPISSLESTQQNGIWKDFDPSDGGRLNHYDKIIATIQGAVDALPVDTVLNVRGVLWMQGESDATASMSSSYESNLTEVVASIRSDIGTIVASSSGKATMSAVTTNELDVFIGSIQNPDQYSQAVIDAQNAVAAADSHVFVVNGTTGLSLMASDDWLEAGVHYDTAGQVLLGERFAAFAIPRYDDADGDGMLDTWETIYFGGSGIYDGTGDQDGDGFIDLHEYLAGTDPTNDVSLLQVTEGAPGAASNEFVISWSAVTNKTYMILDAADLLGPSWATNTPDIVGVEPMCVHTVLTSGASTFFKIRLQE